MCVTSVSYKHTSNNTLEKVSANCEGTGGDVASAEVKWIIIAVCGWVTFIFLVWLFRTCTDPIRRERLKSSLCCLELKSDIPPAYDTAAYNNAVYNIATDNTDSGNPIYYTPPPAYTPETKSDSIPKYDSANASRRIEDLLGPRPPGRIRPARMVKCRSTLSNLVLHLDTIKEENGEDLADVHTVTCTLQTEISFSESRRTRSYPDNLSSVATFYVGEGPIQTSRIGQNVTTGSDDKEQNNFDRGKDHIV